jgi:hypothetical protein
LQEFRSKCQRGDAVHGILQSGGNDDNNNASSITTATATATIKGNQEACLPESKIIKEFGMSAGKRVLDDSAWRFLQNAVPSYRRYNPLEI